MTARLHLTCDHHRSGRRCCAQWTGDLRKYGGALPAAFAARTEGWHTDGVRHQCPTGGHDEDQA